MGCSANPTFGNSYNEDGIFYNRALYFCGDGDRLYARVDIRNIKFIRQLMRD